MNFKILISTLFLIGYSTIFAASTTQRPTTPPPSDAPAATAPSSSAETKTPDWVLPDAIRKPILQKFADQFIAAQPGLETNITLAQNCAQHISLILKALWEKPNCPPLQITPPPFANEPWFDKLLQDYTEEYLKALHPSRAIRTIGDLYAVCSEMWCVMNWNLATSLFTEINRRIQVIVAKLTTTTASS